MAKFSQDNDKGTNAKRTYQQPYTIAEALREEWPHDDTAEQLVLSAMLYSENAIAEVSGILQEDDFYDPRHQILYRYLIEGFATAKIFDANSIAIELRAKGDLDKVGGLSYLIDIQSAAPVNSSATYYAKIIQMYSAKRKLIAASYKIIQLGYSSDKDEVGDILNTAQSEIYAVAANKTQQDYVQLGEFSRDEVLRMHSFEGSNLDVTGIPTGFTEIDDITHGLQPGQLVVVAGRPAMGKSTLAVDFARVAAIRHKFATVIFSLEMNKMELFQRILSAESGADLNTVRNPSVAYGEFWERIDRFNQSRAIQECPLFMDDSPNTSLMEIRSKCRRLKQSEDLKLVVIDYLQLLSAGHWVESRQQEVSEFSRSLKLLAKELEVPVVAISQLNRGSESRTDHVPQMSDLRESGAIEQDADMVFLVHRPEYYNPEDRPNQADIILAKHRNGTTATFALGFDGAHSRFTNEINTVDFDNLG